MTQSCTLVRAGLLHVLALSAAALAQQPSLPACAGKYAGHSLTQHELDGLLGRHRKWLKAQQRLHAVGAATEYQRRPNLCGVDLRGLSLAGADLWEGNLQGANLSGANLSGADLRHASLQEANLSRADISNASLQFSNLASANLVGAIAHHASFAVARLGHADLEGADLRNADLGDADLSEAWVRMAQLGGADLTGAHCGRANFAGARLTGAVLNRADFEGARLSDGGEVGVPFVSAVMRGATVRGAELRGLDFTGIDLQEVDFTGSDLVGARLSATHLDTAILDKAVLRGAVMERASLKGASLRASDFTGATLRGAQLSDAQLQNAILDHANLSGASLRSASLDDARLSGARLDDADIEGARLNRADLTGALLRNVNARGVQFSDASLTNAGLDNVDMTNADLRNANVLGLSLECSPGALPRVESFAAARGLAAITFTKSPHCLVQLRAALANLGLRDEERQLTFAVEHTRWRHARSGSRSERYEALFKYVMFEATCDYGMAPGRPLRLVGLLILLCWPLYYVALVKHEAGGIWVEWAEGPGKEGGVRVERMTPAFLVPRIGEVPSGAFRASLSVVLRLICALYFSVLSAFQLGWHDVNVGTWLARIQSRDYALRPIGWVRTVSGVQSILSMYLVALWAMVYFGHPFE